MIGIAAGKAAGCTLAFGSVAGTVGYVSYDALVNEWFSEGTSFLIKIQENSSWREKKLACNKNSKKYKSLKLEVTENRNKALLSCEDSDSEWRPTSLTKSLGQEKATLTCTPKSNESLPYVFECSVDKGKLSFEEFAAGEGGFSVELIWTQQSSL